MKEARPVCKQMAGRAARPAVCSPARGGPPPMTDPRPDPWLPDFLRLLGASAFSTLAGRALAVVIIYQVYELTHSKLAIGWLGLAEAIPALSLALFGGHVADRTSRRRIMLITQAAAVLGTLAL